MAHKLILAASSPLFREMLVKHPHPQPLLFLKGVKYVDLKAILSFVYSGEVELEQGRLDNFLQVGQELQVKGLTKEEAMPQSLISSSAVEDDSDKNRKRKEKDITWFPDNFRVNELMQSSELQNAPDGQEISDVPGGKMQMELNNNGSSSTFASCNNKGTDLTMVTLKKDQDSSQEIQCPTICTQGTLQQVLKTLSLRRQTLTSSTETGKCGLDIEASSVGCPRTMDASSLHDNEVEFSESSYNEDFSEVENGNMQLETSHSYPGNFPDFLEESKKFDNRTTFCCKLCKKTKVHRSALLQHIESAHFPGTFVHTCKFCAKVVTTKSALNNHLNSCKNRFFQVDNKNKS